MKNNEFLFEIISSEGKKYSAEISLLNIKTSGGEVGILKNHYPLVAFLDISTLNIVVENRKEYFAVSGASLNFKDNKATILVDTFEKREEIDKDRVLKKKDEALKKISLLQKENSLDLISAERSLKKALNRLSLLK
ncbi:MAG: ATP synthase F1 subunit epsilon [Candidatus Onthovivens sp.]|nr:ATP synthase F1 subunit epsilon [Candidatus Onthovivens sp.]